MEFEQLAKSYEYGLSKIYEMVINNNPSYAYLLEGNSLVDQKMVMAHVYGHVDFFKNNFFFSQDQPPDDRRHGEPRHARPPAHRAPGHRQGRELHRRLPLAREPDRPACRRSSRASAAPERDEGRGAEGDARRCRASAPSRYMDKFINPPEYLDEQQQKMERERDRPQKNSPSEPERDVLLFLLEHAPLERWERDVLEIVRDEAYYFAPQRADQDHERGLGHLLALARS